MKHPVEFNKWYKIRGDSFFGVPDLNGYIVGFGHELYKLSPPYYTPKKGLKWTHCLPNHVIRPLTKLELLFYV